jgi:plastocyanin
MRWFKLSLVGVLMLGVFFVGLTGNRGVTLAQDASGQTHLVIAGMDSGDISANVFAPAAIQVHQGDTVRWLSAGFHNIHFEEANADLLIPLEQDGKSILQLNPAVLLPSIQSGGTYSGGDANNGIAMGGPPAPYFELKIDAATGIYHYFCDIHPGMTGAIEVVDSATALPSAVDGITSAYGELSATVNAGNGVLQAAKAAPAAITDAGATITVGGRSGQASIYGFFPSYIEINAGQSVTWTVAADSSPNPFGIGSVPLPSPDQLFGIIPAEAGPPTVVIPDVGTNGNLPSGSTINAGDSWYSGILDPGESYTLTFSEPGIYQYSDGGPGKTGVIIVK